MDGRNLWKSSDEADFSFSALGLFNPLEEGIITGEPRWLSSFTQPSLIVFKKAYKKRSNCGYCWLDHEFKSKLIRLLIRERIKAGIINELTRLKRSTH